MYTEKEEPRLIMMIGSNCSNVVLYYGIFQKYRNYAVVSHVPHVPPYVTDGMVTYLAVVNQSNHSTAISGKESCPTFYSLFQAVENAILQNSKVNACVVLAVGEEGTDKQLVAYVVPTQEITAKVLRSDLKQRLPNYMIPAHILFLKQ